MVLASAASCFDTAKLLGDTVDNKCARKHGAQWNTAKAWGRLRARFGHSACTQRNECKKTKYVMAGKPVSRILSSTPALPLARRGDHSSRSRFASGLQQPTRGS